MADRPTFGERLADRRYRQRPGAYGVAIVGGRVLVVDAPEGRFLPGGALEANEDPAAALRREVREETGYDVHSVEPLGGASQLILARADGEPIEKSGTFFLAALSPEPVADVADVDASAIWLDAAEARATLTDESHRWAVERALERATTGATADCSCPSDVDPRIARFFNSENRARREGRDQYVMGSVTRALARALRAAGPGGRTVLEPGCGPGGLLLELLDAGAASAAGLDLSDEAVMYAGERLAAGGHGDRVHLRVGDAATAQLGQHDWVVLDKVICCYARVDALLANTIGAARWLYSFAIPASYGWRGVIARAIVWIEDLTNTVRGRPCPGYVHDVRAIERRLTAAGFEPLHRETVGIWHVGLYRRPAEAGARA